MVERRGKTGVEGESTASAVMHNRRIIINVLQGPSDALGLFLGLIMH